MRCPVGGSVSRDSGQLKAISAVEAAVAQKQTDRIAVLEDALAAAREQSARAMHDYRDHRAATHGGNRTMTAGTES